MGTVRGVLLILCLFQGTFGLSSSENNLQLLSVEDESLVLWDMPTGQRDVLVSTYGSAVSITYSFAQKEFYWVDGMGRINVYMWKSNKTQVLYSGVTGVQSLAVDWLTDQLYWINPTDLAICAGASDGTGFVTILETTMNPTELVLHPPTSTMFWMNRDESGQMFLESAAMDGSLRKTLAILTAEETKALTVDSVTGRLFWISKYKESIETIFLDGGGRFSILGAFPRGTEVLGFALFEEWFYWSDGKQLWQTSRNSPQQSTALMQSSSSLLAIFHPLQQTNASASPCANAACSHVCLPSPRRVPGYICACPDGMILRSSGKCENLVVLYAIVNHLHKLEFDVTGVKKVKVLDLPEAITSFDFDWKRNWIYWVNATGQLKKLKPQQNQSELIHTPVPVCFLRVDQEAGSVYWLSCSGHLIGMNEVNSHLPKTLYDTTRVITELHLDWMRGSLFWIEDRRILRMNLTDWGVWELLDASEAELGHLVLDIKSNRLIWNDQNAGMISLSIPRNEVTFLNGSWSSVESLVAAYDPYLLSLQGRGLVLWNSRQTRSVSAIEVEQLNAKAVMMKDSEQTDGQTLSSVAKVCPRTFVSCRDGSKCIPNDHLCDGEKDCKDGSDERNCSEGCNQPGNFQCLDRKKCIDPAMVCDGNAQCSDGSDEANCNKGIQECDFTCDNEKCFPLNVRCDGVQNCLDLTDERDCENSIPSLPARACPRTSVSCLDGSDCIFFTLLCDGDLDCKDGSDEENCRMDCRKPGYFQCLNGSKCLKPGQVCDGIPQCEDQSDEAKCRRPTECAFVCHNGRCLPSHMQCDGKEDCVDGSDEENCIPSDKSDLFHKVQTPTCLNESVLCPGEGICIAKEKLCDGVEDCADASDEKNCLQQCNAGYFRCPEGKCVKKQLVCDGIPHCSGGSDEQGCPGKQCAFSCDKNTKCFPETVRCDGRKDCKDGSDEVHCNQKVEGRPNGVPARICPRTFVTCSDGSDCIPNSHLCDGDKDCNDGSDEENCPLGCNKPEIFRCQDGRKCIELGMVCDGEAQCFDRSDEVNCQKAVESCGLICDNSKCLPLHMKCDGVLNCLDQSDESNCQMESRPPVSPARNCPRTFVSCRDGSDCISNSHLCDGESDCADESDEEYCRADCSRPGHFHCLDKKKCLKLKQVCDGVPQCEDQSDEARCEKPLEDCGFICGNGQCLPLRKQCDGKEDCGDGSDEADCVPKVLATSSPPLACQSLSHPCLDQKGCFTPEQSCNGVSDCQDGSDEANCQVQLCKPGFFQCLDGKCIEEQLVCDGTPQCPSGSDEQNCPVRPCAFSCDENTKCFPESVRCDGKVDCGDGADEASCNEENVGVSVLKIPTAVPTRVCPRTFVTCRDGSDCIPSSHLCDGDKDCKDGSDEANCLQGCNKPENIRCMDGRKCIEPRMVCDGKAQCFDGSDESNCQKAMESCDFLCDNDKCFTLQVKCDGVLNCLDQTDESDCKVERKPEGLPVRTCPRTFVSCRDSSDCISFRELCDGDLDCADGSDEEHCRANCSKPGHFQCLDKKKCLKLKQVCDGVPQCDDQSDEAQCKKPVEDCGFFCGNGRCLPAHVKCDGKQDCADGADERNCVPKIISVATSSPPPLTCPSPSSPCLDQKGCVTLEQTCNGVNDCQDGSDEANCPVRPCKKPGFFQCADGKCIEEQLVCDGFRHCPSGSDEQNCPVSPCAFTCDKNTKCFSEIVLCDGKEDCADGTDEAKCASIKGLPTAPMPLKCPRTFVMCQDGSDCIPSDQLCDDEKDCTDGSDEVDCPEQCQPDYFRCQNGRKCIEDRLRCDGFAQCPDGSDEVGCRKPTETCSFHCDGNSHCFPETFKCDGEQDCLDGTDEANCAHEECGQEEFQCSNGQCISSSLRCDGGADCRDHSDELNCSKLHHCPSDRRCPDSKECLLEEWLCDGEPDCEDGSDEKACKWPEVTCNQNQWTCASNTQCIPKEWHCDGQLDCRDGSDEAGCIQSCGSHHFQCNNGECLNTSLACNGRTNCVDGSDEGGDCKKNCKQQCSQICYKTPAGPKCACNPGFTLAKDGSSCMDINECAVVSPNVCSQTCHNSEGSYTCDCLSGYLLEADGHSCKASGTEPFLLAAFQSDVLLYGLQSATEDILVSTARNAIFSLDYDWKAQRVFWLSLGSQNIKWISIDQKQKGTLVKGIKSDCIAVDWVGRNLYWTDGISGQILAVSMYSTAAAPTNYTVVLDEDLDQPRALVLNPHSGFMYWSEIGADPQIEQAGMDGSSRKVLLSKGLGWPISLALDFITSRLYWSDDKLKSIGSVKLDGTDFKLMQLEESPSPFSLSVFEGFLYWSDTKKRVIQRADKSTGKNRKTLLKRLGQPFGLKVMHEILQPVLPNPCQKLECSHVCLIGPEQKAICRCPPGLILETNKATCTLPRDTAFLFVASSTSITQVYLRSIQSNVGMKILPEHKVFSVPIVNQISAMAYVLKNHTLFVADSEGQFIGQFKLKEPSLAFRGKVLQMDRVMVTAMAVDWITLTLYWSGGFPAFICVTSANGAHTAAVLENLNQVNSIALHPPTGYMCFSELDVKRNKFKIECSFMNGKNRKLVWSEGSRPGSLVFSESGAVLYWADPGMGVIGSVALDGLKYNEYRTGHDVVAFAFGDNLLFWTTGNDTVKMWYSDGLQTKHLWFETKMKIVGLQVFSKYSQQGTNACVHNGGCNYFCLPYPGGKTCKCPMGYRSRGEADCVKEIHCAEFSKPCRDGRKCILNQRFCDGEDDCLDGSDEEGCDTSDERVRTDQKPKEKPSATPTREQPLQGSPRGLVYSGNPTMSAEELLRNLESKSCDREKCHFNGDCYLVEGKVKCNCLLGYGGEYCGGPVFKPISVPLTLGVAFVLLAFFAAVVIFAVVQKRRKEAQRNKDKQKTAMKDLEGDMFSSQTFANDIYDGEGDMTTPLEQ
ncbi:low-density lipoprotein receptor-related protein 2 isoform X1 [Polypterus senegalus]|uniref:low-density lipoprotein receptor-related protein 2 isoform X1 n=1 Tax=Polypterus senegalus TaxID=55291 RepID=UPI001962E6A5|nr:low-density lipoprotein receptor-related protein 2 isoform X1 [Polypterus senegalus]